MTIINAGAMEEMSAFERKHRLREAAEARHATLALMQMPIMMKILGDNESSLYDDEYEIFSHAHTADGQRHRHSRGREVALVEENITEQTSRRQLSNHRGLGSASIEK